MNATALISSDPCDFRNGLWLTIPDAAFYFGRDASTIRSWCRDGTLTEFGYVTARDLTGHWYVRMSPAQIKKFRQMKKGKAGEPGSEN